MKTFCFNKTLLLLIYLLQIILSDIPKPFKPFISARFSDELIVEKPEKKYQIKKNDFKPFVSVAPLSMTELEGSNDDTNYTQIDFSVKCMFIDNFNLFNIAGLGKNALDDSVPEKGYEYKDKKSNSILIYNFCHDLKSSTNCPYDKKQIFVKKDGKCDSYANSIGVGNTWYKGEYEGKISLKIVLNQDDKHRVIYQLICNPDKKGNHEPNDTISYIDKPVGDILETLLYIETSEACPKVDFYVVWKFINDFSFIFAGLLILFGLFNCVLGKRFARITSFLLALFSATVLFVVFSQFILPAGCKYWIIWVMLVIGAIIGCTLGYFVYKNHEKVVAFVVGGLGGFFLGQFLFSLFGYLIPINSLVVNILFVIICIIAVTIVALFLRDPIIIGFTAFIGSYALIRGISLFAGYFPNEFTIIDLKNRGEDDQIKELLTWRVYVYLFFILVATGLSIYVQIKVNQMFKKKEDGPETPDDNLVDPSS